MNGNPLATPWRRWLFQSYPPERQRLIHIFDRDIYSNTLELLQKTQELPWKQREHSHISKKLLTSACFTTTHVVFVFIHQVKHWDILGSRSDWVAQRRWCWMLIPISELIFICFLECLFDQCRRDQLRSGSIATWWRSRFPGRRIDLYTPFSTVTEASHSFFEEPCQMSLRGLTSLVG